MNDTKKWVLQILGDPTGGIRNHVHEIIKSNRKFGVEIHYIHGETLDSNGNVDIDGFDLMGLNRVQYYISKKPHLSDIYNIISVFKYCRYHGIDAIHGHGAKGGIYSRITAFLLGIPSIYTPHGGSIHANFGILEGFIYRLVERLFKSLTRLYLFESSYSYQSFVNSCGPLRSGRYLINHNGVDANVFVAKRNWSTGMDDTVNILVAGVLREAKGQAIAIEALRKLNICSETKFHLHFCGGGPDRDKLISLIEGYSLIDNVTFHGDVKDILPFYESCNIVVIPSLFESFGYVAVEAALMRRPVIASNCGGLPEIIQNNKTGLLFEMGNAATLADKILEIVEDINKTNVIVTTANSYSKKNFCSKNMLENIYSAYCQIMQ
jgi:glycosyltransferase involved in cell wall biosynthesis